MIYYYTVLFCTILQAADRTVTSTMPTPPPPPPSAAPPKSFPYDHLFKLLMIGDAGVGKVR